MSPVALIALSADELATLVRTWCRPRYRARQILRWLYRARLTDIAAMTDLSHADRTRLAAEACIGALAPSTVLTSEDGTRKFIFSLEDGKRIESVLIPDTSSRSTDRLTLCLSPQVGCTLDCTFCLTGQMGLQRNLSAHEIVGQVLAVQRVLDSEHHLTTLVLMGMGEPLANAAAVAEAIHRLTNQTWGVGFSPIPITPSSAWLSSPPKHVAGLGVNLAVSRNDTT